LERGVGVLSAIKRKYMNKIKIAGCQIDISFGNVNANLEKVISYISRAAQQGAQLIVFPECALTGYCFESMDEVKSAAMKINGPFLTQISDICAQLNIYCILGFLEQDGKTFYNTAGLFCPDRSYFKYRKVHLPVLGVDRFVQPGNLGFPVINLPVGKIGLNICYDQRFPESARVLMLQGAQLIVVPTNEPDSAKDVCHLLTRARAYENRVHYVWVNRVGTERGTTFMGATQVVDCNGTIISQGGNSTEEIIYADLHLADADKKRSIFIPDEYEIDLVKDRVPDFYRNITEEKVI